MLPIIAAGAAAVTVVGSGVFIYKKLSGMVALQEKFNDKEAELANTETTLYNVRRELKAEQGKLSKSETELDRLRKDIKAIKASWTLQLKTFLAEIAGELNTQYGGEVGRITQEVQDKQDELDRLRDTHSQDIQTIETSRRLQLKTLLAEIVGELNTQYGGEVGRITQEISNKDLALGALHRQLSAARTERDAIITQRDQTLAEKDQALETLNSQLTAQAKAHDRQKKEWSTADSEHQAALEAIKTELEARKQELADLQGSHETVKAERDTAIKELHQALTSQPSRMQSLRFGVFGSSTPKLPLEDASSSRNASVTNLTGRR